MYLHNYTGLGREGVEREGKEKKRKEERGRETVKERQCM